MADLPKEPWIGLLAADPRPWLLAAEEPAARWLTLTALLDRGPGDPETRQAHAGVLADPCTAALIQRLPDWERDAVTTGHNSPTFAPNLLAALWRMGLRAGDSPRVEEVLDQMLDHQDAAGRFQARGRWRGQEEARWGTLLCDTHAIAEVLVRFERTEDPRTRRALDRMAADAAETAQGPGWLCRPDEAIGFRGPGRKGDICPQVTVEAIRAMGMLPARDRPSAALSAARTICQVWLARGEIKPYLFGHGRQFKTVKWPPMWYDAYAVLDALSMYAELWEGAGPSGAEHRRAVCELAACLVAYNFGREAKVTPQSCCRGFEAFSWGQKKAPSPFATALLCTVLRRLDSLAAEIAAVDVLRLPSSKGGTGVPVPPRR